MSRCEFGRRETRATVWRATIKNKKFKNSKELLLESVYASERRGHRQSPGYRPQWLSLLTSVSQQEASVPPRDTTHTWKQQDDTEVKRNTRSDEMQSELPADRLEALEDEKRRSWRSNLI